MSACSYTLADVCVPVSVDVEQTTFAADGGWVAGAFFLGLLVGAVVTALLVRPCLREWQKKKRQDEDETGMLTTAAAAPVVMASVADSHKVVKEKAGKKKKGSRFKRLKKGEEIEEVDVEIEPGKYRGMVDVIIQTSSVGADSELASQDMNAVIIMDTEHDEEKELLLLQCLDNLMKKLVVKNNISEDYYRLFMKRTREDVSDVKNLSVAETKEAEEEARKDSKLSKDSQALESELLNIQTQANIKLSQRQREQREKMRHDLIRSSGMSEAEVEALMEKLMGQMAALEAMLGLEQARQKRSLEERLAKRRQVLEYNKMQTANRTEDINAGVDMVDTLLAGLVSARKLVDKQREELLHQYQEEVDTVRQHYNTEALRQRQSLAEKLQQRRQKQLHKLAEKHVKEKWSFLQTSEKGVGTTDTIQGYHDLVLRQHRDTEEASTELDQADIQEMDKLNKELHSQEVADVEAKLGMQMAEVGRQANMGSSDVNRLLKQHQQQMERYHGNKQRERQAILANLQARLAHRLQVVDQKEQEEEMEMESLRQQQTATLNKVLSTNIEMTNEARERILKKHEQNMHSLTNQLQRSKLRQQKNLEVKLNQRRARLGDLQAKQEEMRRAKKDAKAKEKEKLEQQLASEISAEEEKIEAARLVDLAQLRQQLAIETEEALRQQDQEIGLLIGRLQVGQARRQAILRRQDKTLKELQDQLEERMTEGELPRSYTDQLIQQHHNQMSHLNDHIQRSREKQERIIMEKLQTKKHMRENQLESQMEEEAQVEYYHQQQRGAGLASSVLLQTLLEQRHQRAMSELESEMKTELEKSKEELNTTLELELQQELESQKQQFLTQLAAVSGISHDELHQAVDAAVTETGVGDKTAKKLAKDLRAGIKRAKTTMSETYGGEVQDQEYGLQQAPTGLESFTYADSDDMQPQVNRSGKKKKKKKTLSKPPAYTDDHGYGDDDF